MHIKQYVFISLFLLTTGFVYSQVNMNNLDEAKKQYQEICSLDAENYAALNNLGNIYVFRGELDSAETCYLKAENILQSKMQPANLPNEESRKKYQQHLHGVILNLGTLYATADDTIHASETYARVIRDSSDLKEAIDLLGLPSTRDDVKHSKQTGISSAKVNHFAAKATKNTKSTKKETKKPEGKKISKNKVRKGEDYQGKVEDVFYWIHEY